MVDRKDVVLLEAGESQGTGFLIAPDRLVTALHVIAKLEDGLVATDDAGQPLGMGPITATYYSEARGYWSEPIKFDLVPGQWANDEDWVRMLCINPSITELMLAAAGPDSELAANAMNNLGLCYRRLGDIPKALDSAASGARPTPSPTSASSPPSTAPPSTPTSP